MPSARSDLKKDVREIKPAAPEEILQGLLAVPFVQKVVLPAGSLHDGCGAAGEYLLVGESQGTLTITTQDQYAPLEAGQAFAARVDGPYTVQAVSDCACILMPVRGELADRFLKDKLKSGYAIFHRGSVVLREAALAMSVLEEERPPVPGETASTLAYSMLVKLRALPEEEPVYPRLVESAIAVIQEEFPFLDGLDDLAERLEVSKAHLSRVFAQQTGISPGKYITRVKLQYAKLLLQDEHVTIAYVAESCGFSNANYFAKVFRKETGMSPTEYIQTTPLRRAERGPQTTTRPTLW
jgi:AraC-like DNA-binding protein